MFFLFLLVGLYSEAVGFLSEEEAFCIAAVEMTVPVNDARTTLICYGYSLSLPLFFLAFYIVTRLGELLGGKKITLRVLSLLLLIYSYTTQSLLVFTGLIWLYLFYLVCKENEGEKLLGKIGIFFRKYWDYFLVPFAFSIVKGIFFKAYGRYENYNSVTLKSLIKGTLFSPFAALKTYAIIGRSYLRQIGVVSVIVFAVLIFIYFIVKGNSIKTENIETFSKRKKQIVIFILGAVVYYAGIFAYVIVRGGGAIDSTGVGGRDAILVGFGIAMMVVAFSRFLPVKKSLQNVIPIFLIVFGIFHFNDWYLNY